MQNETKEKNYMLWKPVQKELEQAASSENSDQMMDFVNSLVEAFKTHFYEHYGFECHCRIEEDLSVEKYKEVKEKITENELLVPILSLKGNAFFFVCYNQVICDQLTNIYFGGEFPSASSQEATPLKSSEIESLKHLSALFYRFLMKDKNIDDFEKIEVDEDKNCFIKKIFIDEFESSEMRFILTQEFIDLFNDEKDSIKVVSKPERINPDSLYLDLRATLYHTIVDISYLLKLREGELIPITSKEEVKIGIDNRYLFTGLLGGLNNQKAIKIS